MGPEANSLAKQKDLDAAVEKIHSMASQLEEATTRLVALYQRVYVPPQPVAAHAPGINPAQPTSPGVYGALQDALERMNFAVIAADEASANFQRLA